ncbi:MAG TPA: hypothetical protein VMT24_07545 [Aggregatilineaceae bacterium]|jgi:hypothetical protein|nr:hypothetical protein [Aggregatilineaceae bacterium]
MGIRVTCDDPDKGIIRYEFERMWNWDDFVKATLDDDNLLDPVDHPFTLILDMRRSTEIPTQTVTWLSSAVDLIQPRLKMVVFVGDNAWAETLVNIFSNAYGQYIKSLARIKKTRTLEEAYAVIDAQEQSGW